MGFQPVYLMRNFAFSQSKMQANFWPSGVCIAHDFLATLQPLLSGRAVHLFVDAEAARCHSSLLAQLQVQSRFVVPSGEQHKTLQTATHMWQHLLAVGADRAGLVLAVGGGVTTDMAAFVASTYMRGLPVVLCPTTLLSQVDASVGGKTGIDFEGGKNLIGTFYQPEQVVIWPGFLATLPPRQLLSGYAEVLKHGLIADAAYWDHCKAGLPTGPVALAEVVTHSVSLKAQVVQQDPTEKGLRKILNFGHTLGHAIESYYLATDEPLLHGEAVALGMLLEARLAALKTGLPMAAVQEIAHVLTGLGYPTRLPAQAVPAVLQLMRLDKKNRSGSFRFSLLRAIGQCDYDIEVSEALVTQSIAESQTPW